MSSGTKLTAMTTQPENQYPSLPSQEYLGPTVELSVGEEKYALTWANTTLRTFFLEDGTYDHIMHKLPDGKHVAFSTAMPGMEDVVVALIERNFPQHLSPALDEATIGWYASMEAREIEDFEFPPFSE